MSYYKQNNKLFRPSNTNNFVVHPPSPINQGMHPLSPNHMMYYSNNTNTNINTNKKKDVNHPLLVGDHCKAFGCLRNHKKHYCVYCKNEDSYHTFNDCMNKPLNQIPNPNKNECFICKSSELTHNHLECSLNQTKHFYTINK